MSKMLWQALKGFFSLPAFLDKACPEGMAQMGLIGPMKGAIPAQFPNRYRLATPPGSASPTFFKQWWGFFYVPQEQISESAAKRDLRFFVLIWED